jgi:N-acetyl-anhydromuramyl-L-alanine amidase AmpD
VKFVQAKHYYTGGNKPRLVVIHTMEAPEKGETAENIASWFAGMNAPRASAHYCVSNTETVQCVEEEDGAWHTPGALPGKGGVEINRSSIGVEHAGYARQTAEEWSDEYSIAMLERSAQLVAEICARYDIPATKLSPEELKEPGASGICGHVDCTKATGVGTHWDPGPFYPWAWYLERVRAHLYAENDDDIPLTAHIQGIADAAVADYQDDGDTDPDLADKDGEP